MRGNHHWQRVAASLLAVSVVLCAESVVGAQVVTEPTEHKGLSCPKDDNAAPDAAKQSSWLGLGAGFGVLNLPNLAVGAEVAAELRPEAIWPIDLAFTYFFENVDELSKDELDLRAASFVTLPFPPGGSRTSFTAAQLGAALCPLEHDLASGSVLLCGGVYGGLLVARSEGFLGARRRTSPLYGIQVYARWHFMLGGPLGISYSAGLFAALGRERFGYLDRSGAFHEQFQASPVGGRLDLALTYGF